MKETIIKFKEYARGQGSHEFGRYEKLLPRMIFKEMGFNKINGLILFNPEDYLTYRELSFIDTAKYICADSLQEGMINNMYYKEIYQLAKRKVRSFAQIIESQLKFDRDFRRKMEARL